MHSPGVRLNDSVITQEEYENSKAIRFKFLQAYIPIATPSIRRFVTEHVIVTLGDARQEFCRKSEKPNTKGKKTKGESKEPKEGKKKTRKGREEGKETLRTQGEIE